MQNTQQFCQIPFKLWPLIWETVEFLKVHFLILNMVYRRSLDTFYLNRNWHFSLWYGIETLNIGFRWLIAIDRDVAIDHQTVSSQFKLYLINRFHSLKFNQDAIHSVAKCYKGNIMAITNGQCQCNVEGKTCERNSSSFSCIEMYSVKNDKQALFHSASWWWQTSRVALAWVWAAMLGYYWRNMIPVAGLVGILGRHFNMAGWS